MRTRVAALVGAIVLAGAALPGCSTPGTGIDPSTNPGNGALGQAVPVDRKASDRAGSLAGEAQHRKLALPGVGHPDPAWRELLAPRVGGRVESAPGGELPFGLCR